jgi:hypothetical protein
MLFSCSAVQLLVAQDELFVSQLIEDILDQLLFICSAAYYSRLPLAEFVPDQLLVSCYLAIISFSSVLTTKSAGFQFLNLKSADKAVSTNDHENVF